MNLQFSDHARQRMAERMIAEDDVAWALRHRRGAPTPGALGTLWIWGYASGRVLKVCVRINDQSYVVPAAWAD
jgi:hypothetical protein